MNRSKTGMILFVGELLADFITLQDFYVAEEFVIKTGGSPGNIARFASQLGVPTKIISRVGDDPIGSRILKKLEQAGVDISSVQIDKQHGTTLVFVRKTPNSPDFFVIRGADRYLKLDEDEIENILGGANIVHLSCWMLTHEQLYETTMKIVRKALEMGIQISFDPNCRDKLFSCKKINLSRVFELLKYTTYSKPSIDDALALFGMPDNRISDCEKRSEGLFSSNEIDIELVKYYVSKFHEHGVKYVVLTVGKDGAFASDGESLVHIPASARKVVDATGAGDGFWAGIYYGLINGYDFLQACNIGSMVAGYIVGFVGAEVDITDLKKEFENNILRG
ncbi:sugar kinase [Fervidobacterium pennivorans subsp. shakshaketiis]|jgi:fructokinase|uniref:Sugar kinase, ribokinase n=1 Tax=Fervidobacterium pennivorans (strain DSM 9078 / Ven5) TaxID=771875 RepID=H9UAV2_FERPD|nr:sugar kinase [Fervidobacterium pennivorans]AFG34645.1 sugar kinase, ribokinase [Fervidobacterium pennivorans DSM 9078]